MKKLIVYHDLRTAHLERLQRSPEMVQVIYRNESYDFTRDLARKSGARRVSLLGVCLEIIRGNYDVIEVNEPLFLRAFPTMITALIAGDMRYFAGKKRAAYVTYAIENLDVINRLRNKGVIGKPVAWGVQRTLGHFARKIDRFAFGTEDAFALYGALLPMACETAKSKIFTPIEPPCNCGEPLKTPHSAVFIGALEERKGIKFLMQSWHIVKAQVPQATLMIMGKGELTHEVEFWARRQADVIFINNPETAVIHRELSAAKVLVLPSVESADWREQIGLPIVEGLSHGCEIVTSTSTGIRSWLKNKGHFVSEVTVDGLARAIVSSMNSPERARAILASLPRESGRMAADHWMSHSDT